MRWDKPGESLCVDYRLDGCLSMRNHSNMSEKDALAPQRVCIEPLLYAFAAPRTIAAALAEYEHHLHQNLGLSSRRARATRLCLEHFLDPIEAPLVSLTPELAKTICDEALAPAALFWSDPRRLSLLRARRFFSWAEQRGYVSKSPFAQIAIASSTSASTDWLS